MTFVSISGDIADGRNRTNKSTIKMSFIRRLRKEFKTV